MNYMRRQVRVAIDTNILVYAEGVNGDAPKASALTLIKRLANGIGVVPVQVLSELFVALVRKEVGKEPRHVTRRWNGEMSFRWLRLRNPWWLAHLSWRPTIN